MKSITSIFWLLLFSYYFLRGNVHYFNIWQMLKTSRRLVALVLVLMCVSSVVARIYDECETLPSTIHVAQGTMF